MGKSFIAAGDENPSLILPVLAIISIILYSIFPQHTVASKTNNNTKTKISQNILLPQSNREEVKIIKKEGPQEFIGPKEFVGPKESARIIPKKKMRVLATAYSSTVDQCDSSPFITANGTHVHDGTLAANFLKFGTKVKFPALYGDKIFIVEDRMRSNTKVDLWFPTRQEAINFGARVIEMEIL